MSIAHKISPAGSVSKEVSSAAFSSDVKFIGMTFGLELRRKRNCAARMEAAAGRRGSSPLEIALNPCPCLDSMESASHMLHGEPPLSGNIDILVSTLLISEVWAPWSDMCYIQYVHLLATSK